MGLFDFAGKALADLGLGQDDLRKVFRGTIDRLNRIAPVTTLSQRDGMAVAMASMLDELKARDVMALDTHSELMAELKKWHTPPEAK